MKRNERGIALITALFALLLLTGIGLGLLYMSDAETMINANYRNSQQAYFAALAGVQEVRQRMTPSAADLISVPAAAPGNNNSILYLLNPYNGETVDPQNTGGSNYPDGQLCTEFTAFGLSCPNRNSPQFMSYINDDQSSYNTTKALSYKWVRIEQKLNGSNSPYYNQTAASKNSATATTPICWNGSSEFPLTETSDPTCNTGLGSDPPGHTQVYLLTGYATYNNASRYLQMETAIDPPIVTHGAMDSADHVTLNGQLTVNGYDACTCKCTYNNQGTPTSCGNPPSGTGYYSSTCDTKHNAIYSATTVDNPNSSETVIAGTSPAIAANQPWTWNVQSLYQRYATQAGAVNVTGAPYNWNCSSGCGTQNGITLGTLPSPFPPNPPYQNPVPGLASQTTIVPGDLKVTSDTSSGAGVLVVNGNLEIDGGFQFYGLIIVTGTITFSGGGSHPANIYGGIIAGQQSVTNLNNTLSGGVNITFDYCALPQGNTTQPPRSLALRDINF